MTDAAIKAALVAAGEAARKAFIVPGCCMESTGCELPPCHCSQVAAAAAVAAFLRALPITHFGLGPWMRSGPDLGAEIAAAVERAAREAGDE
jgi:hypothetical protein